MVLITVAFGIVAKVPASTAAAANAATQPSVLTWAPPPLDNPVTIQVTNQHCKLKLDPQKDYRLQMRDTPLTADGGLTIRGGHNIVLIGGEIRFDTPVPTTQRRGYFNARRGLYIVKATGTVHIEGLWIHGEHLLEGINVDMRTPGAILQLENLRVGTVRGSFKTNHADCLQCWGGPDLLRVDHFTGFTGYQGIFLQPQQFKSPAPTLHDLRHVDIHATPEAAYLYWQMRPFPLKTEDVWADAKPTRWPLLTLWPKGDPVWKDVQLGSSPGGEFVPEGVAGIHYRSPGYAGGFVPAATHPSPATAPTH
jgi:hypothetical protein